MTIRSHLLFAAVLVAVPAAVWGGPLSGFAQTNLVSDFPGMAIVTYGPAAGDLLGRNFGTGAITAYNLNIGVADFGGNPLAKDGLVVRIDAVPEPASLVLIGGGLVLVALLQRKPRR